MRFVGVDLAWGTRGRTGLAALDDDGTLLDLAELRTESDIVAWLRPHTDGPCLVAMDAPLIVTNPTGRRRCEAELGAVFARHQAGAHPTNTSRPEMAAGSRALRIAEALGLEVDPRSAAPRRAIEVYPHSATVALFDLPTTLKYKHKPGRDLDLLRTESLRLVGFVESLGDASPPLHVADHPGWATVREAVAGATRKVDLKQVEDMIDAVICAYVGLFSVRRPELTTTYGDVVEGYIVTPSLARSGR
jgi:predicted RNase H-like nuclease